LVRTATLPWASSQFEITTPAIGWPLTMICQNSNAEMTPSGVNFVPFILLEIFIFVG
jgi:hypothetical protein